MSGSPPGDANRLRRLLARPVTVAAVLECAMWLALPYIILGAAWAFAHAERLHDLEVAWDGVLPAGADIAAFGEAVALWPALLLLPTTCSAQ